MKCKTMKITAFVMMGLGICGTYLAFMLRYGWYTTPQSALALNAGFAAFLVLCGIAWFFFPSKCLVLAASAGLFVYPPIFDSHEFVAVDWKYAPFIATCIMFVIIAIELRRRVRSEVIK